MNILMLTTVFPPEVRSAALLMGELAESLAHRGHRVTVITSVAEGTARPRKTSFLGIFVELPRSCEGWGRSSTRLHSCSPHCS